MPVPENYNRSETQAESQHLKAADFKLDQKWRLQIEDVDLVAMEARDNQPARKRLVVTFVGREKSLVLNATNQSFMEERLGYNPNDWIGATVVLWRTTTRFEGKSVPAFRFLEAKAGAAPKAAPKTSPKVKEPEPIEVEPIDEGIAAQYDDDSVPFAVLLPILGALPFLGLLA